ncbi:MAG: vitamin K epoxide reductase family protein, partial [Candidatus Spechtbacterales bacterium]
NPLIVLGLAASAAAFVFSAYLTFLQAVVIRDWCSWCLISATISTIIFAFSLYADRTLLPFV